MHIHISFKKLPLKTLTYPAGYEFDILGEMRCMTGLIFQDIRCSDGKTNPDFR